MVENETTTLVSLRLTSYAGEKKDRMASRELTESKHATADSGRVTKSLYSKDFLLPIRRVDAAIRAAFALYALSSGMTGLRLSTEASRPKLEAALDGLFDDRNKAVDYVLDGLDSEIDRRQGSMGDLFDRSDYPSAAQIRARYSAAYYHLPTPAGWKLGTDDETLKRKLEEARTEAFAAAHRDAWERVMSAARDVVTRLNDYTPQPGGKRAKGDFRKSLTESLRTLVETLNSMNVWDDKNLSACLAILKTEIADVAIEALKSDEQARELAIMAAKRVLDKIPGLGTGTKPRPAASDVPDTPYPAASSVPDIPAPAVPVVPAAPVVEDYDDLLD